MDSKWLLFSILLVAILVEHVSGDFFFNRPTPTADQLSKFNLNCVPGRTTIKVTEVNIHDKITPATESDEDYVKSLRREGDENCQICVCSVNGIDSYCMNRTVNQFNECIMLKNAAKSKQLNLPYQHARDLYNRIRRDYIWHNDEIPYSSDAKCYRGHSYYTNDPNANDTTIANARESFLSYGKNPDECAVCYFCVCSVSGTSVGCISRSLWYCNYMRHITKKNAVRDMYTKLFQLDRPAYFRQQSWRMRRTMDKGIYDFIESVNDPEATKEGKCVPFVSQYTDCNDDNICSGCQKCACNKDGEWDCSDVSFCDEDKTSSVEQQLAAGVVDDALFDNALYLLEDELKKSRVNQDKKKLQPSFVPSPVTREKSSESDVLLDFEHLDPVNMLKSLRNKREAAKQTNKLKKKEKHNVKNNNNTIRFYHAVDEINDDTLKHNSSEGTLHAGKIDNSIPPNRPSFKNASNVSQHIDFNHIVDNKIDNGDDSQEKPVNNNNDNSTEKDKVLTKIVVNELKRGNEIIGDAKAPVISNVTFTPENDTLTAMAFIAGNLLNKLWDMEKDGFVTSPETDEMKKDKIKNLVDLFKEPLNLRQEIFLKNALEQLSDAIDKAKDVTDIDNISLCKNIQNSKQILHNIENTAKNEFVSTEATDKIDKPIVKSFAKARNIKQSSATRNAVSKINNVLGLIKKFELVQKDLSGIKLNPKLDLNDTFKNINGNKNEDTNLTSNEKSTMNVFGDVLDKITKLLMPQKNNRKIYTEINSHSITGNNDKLTQNMKEFNIDLSNFTVTAKDKIIFDYLTHMENNPDCILNQNNDRETKSLPKIEGNILLNLSEYYKIKSFADLVNLMKSEKINDSAHSSDSTTTKISTLPQVFATPSSVNVRKTKENKNFDVTKEKLKMHLKTILEDLVELQHAKGLTPNSNIKMIDVLPCIYKVLNDNYTTIIPADPENSVKILKDLKKQLKIDQSRRSGFSIDKPRPRSAAIWERMIKNLVDVYRPKTRRTLEAKPVKSFDEIKINILKVSNSSVTYKKHALMMEVPASEKLMLLKTFKSGVDRYIKVLEDIDLAYDNLSNLPVESISEISDFIDKMSSTVELDSKILNNVERMKTRRYHVPKAMKPKQKINQHMKYSERLQQLPVNMYKDGEISISRKQVLNQLLKNRMQSYLKMKESTQNSLNNDVKYNIAKRVLNSIERGNYDLAEELFKILIMQDKLGPKSIIATTTPNLLEELNKNMDMHNKQPLLQYEKQPPITEMLNQDYLIKQLLNLKVM